jgi:hypothetical protein
MWGEQVYHPRHIFRLCEYNPNSQDGDAYNPLLQTLSAIDNKFLDNDSPGQAGIRALVEDFTDWQERLKIGKARELLSEIVPEDDNTGR